MSWGDYETTESLASIVEENETMLKNKREKENQEYRDKIAAQRFTITCGPYRISEVCNKCELKTEGCDECWHYYYNSERHPDSKIQSLGRVFYAMGKKFNVHLPHFDQYKELAKDYVFTDFYDVTYQ